MLGLNSLIKTFFSNPGAVAEVGSPAVHGRGYRCIAAGKIDGDDPVADFLSRQGAHFTLLLAAALLKLLILGTFTPFPGKRAMNRETPPCAAEFATYHLSQTMLHALREIYRLFDGDIVMALVLGELGQHAVAGNHHGSGRRGHLRPSNAHSIAAASGIPRETVRRKLDKLIAKGWVRAHPDGGLSLNRELETPLHLQFVDYNRELLARMRHTVSVLEGVEF